MKIALLLSVVLFYFGCETVKLNADGNPVTTDPKVNAESSSDTLVDKNLRIALYWENTTQPHPERAAWSDVIVSNTDKYFTVYNGASDIIRFCPKYKILSKDLKTKAIGEFLVALAYYESAFNPRSSAVDVGNKNDRNSYSDGLFQMSGNDSAAKIFNYTYVDLLKPIQNINTAMYQLNIQIKNTGLFILPNSSKYRYWATILDGNKYNQIKPIIDRVIKYAPACK